MGMFKGTQKGDVYSFGIILYEIFRRGTPFADSCLTTEAIIEQIKDPGKAGITRPILEDLKDTDFDYEAPDYILDLINDCWNECPEQRPDFNVIRARTKKLNQGKKNNIMDQMIERMNR